MAEILEEKEYRNSNSILVLRAIHSAVNGIGIICLRHENLDIRMEWEENI